MVITEGWLVVGSSTEPKKQVDTLALYKRLSPIFVQMANGCSDVAIRAFDHAEGSPPSHFQVTVTTLNDSGEQLYSGCIDSIKIRDEGLDNARCDLLTQFFGALSTVILDDKSKNFTKIEVGCALMNGLERELYSLPASFPVLKDNRVLK